MQEQMPAELGIPAMPDSAALWLRLQNPLPAASLLTPHLLRCLTCASYHPAALILSPAPRNASWTCGCPFHF